MSLDWDSTGRELSEVFDNGLLDDHVHVVVKAPGVWAYNYLSTLHLLQL
jgi:hypothetical protein